MQNIMFNLRTFVIHSDYFCFAARLLLLLHFNKTMTPENICDRVSR